MGFWRQVAKGMFTAKELEQLDQQQTQYGHYRPPGIIASIFTNRRTNQWADNYWRDNEVINRANTPLSHLGMDLGHPPGCDCRWCA